MGVAGGQAGGRAGGRWGGVVAGQIYSIGLVCIVARANVDAALTSIREVSRSKVQPCHAASQSCRVLFEIGTNIHFKRFLVRPIYFCQRLTVICIVMKSTVVFQMHTVCNTKMNRKS